MSLLSIFGSEPNNICFNCRIATYSKNGSSMFCTNCGGEAFPMKIICDCGKYAVYTIKSTNTSMCTDCFKIYAKCKKCWNPVTKSNGGLCGGCLKVRYCSVSCQSIDRKYHYQECQNITTEDNQKTYVGNTCIELYEYKQKMDLDSDFGTTAINNTVPSLTHFVVSVIKPTTSLT